MGVCGLSAIEAQGERRNNISQLVRLQKLSILLKHLGLYRFILSEDSQLQRTAYFNSATISPAANKFSLSFSSE